MKKLPITFTFLFSYILLIGCGASSKSVPVKMIECFENNVSNRLESLGFKKEQNLEKTFNTFENFLLKENYIKTVNKKEYRNFIKKVISNPQSFLNIKNHIENLSIYEDHYYLMDPSLMLIECSDYILVTEKHEYTSTLNIQNKIIKTIIRNDYSNFKLVDELFTGTPEEDFEEIVYRIPFIYVIIMNIVNYVDNIPPDGSGNVPN